ncbi:GNAT family N-acetyltransferase [Nannocystis punicea]|uniref:GNAT family N-acetyltransferase n=1 Tax=Nannocystis punicea TaxID=2995304 RepID=A0ABY7HH62_9BACT|nr:GNAT family N-acetyltransferase [Nannocystis poenicansa]WAS98314.1 GNAT family N-acetyltransferase [Nannocystis poenicansa]
MRAPSIRLARPADLAAIATVHAASVRQLCAGHYPPQAIDQWLAPSPGLYARMLRSSTVYVAERGGQVVAFAAVRLATREVRALYVSPGAAGGGLGLRLMRRLERVARAFGMVELRLWATLNAVGFYERLGWRRDVRQSGKRPPHRCVPMRKRLGG